MSRKVKVGDRMHLGDQKGLAVTTIRVTNRSGGTLARGDVVIWDTTNSTPTYPCVTTTTSANNALVAGMVFQTSIANGAAGDIQIWGPTNALKVNGTTDIAKGDWLGTYTTAKIAAKTTGAGAFARALEAYATNDSAGVIDAEIRCMASIPTGLTAHDHSDAANGGDIAQTTFAADLTVGTDKKVQFRDTGIFLQSAADGKVTISADGTGADDITLAGTVSAADNIRMATNKKIELRDDGIYIQSGADGKVTISADGTGTDDITLAGTVAVSDDVLLATDKKVGFRDAGIYIQSGADGKLTISSDGSGADDITISGTVTADDNITLATNKKLQLGDTGTYIHQSADGKILISSDGSGADDITLGGTVTVSDDMTFAANKKIVQSGTAANTFGGSGANTFTGPVILSANSYPKITVTTDNTTGNRTYTAAETIGGYILRDPNGGNRSDVSPTAAALVAAIPGAVVGTAFRFLIKNTANAGETITYTAADATVTLVGTMTIAQSNTKEFLCVLTNVTGSSEACTIYSLFTGVH
jgi:hypothetical protein